MIKMKGILLLSLSLFSPAQPMLIKTITNPFDWNHKEFTYNSENHLLGAIKKGFYHDDEKLVVMNLKTREVCSTTDSCNMKYIFNNDGSKVLGSKQSFDKLLIIMVKDIHSKKTISLLSCETSAFKKEVLNLISFNLSQDGKHIGMLYLPHWDNTMTHIKVDLKTENIQFTKLKEKYFSNQATASLSNDLRLIAGKLYNHDAVGFWNTSDGKYLGKIKTKGRLVTAMTWSSNDRYLIVATEKKPPEGRYLHTTPQTETIHVWDVEKRKCIKTIKDIEPGEIFYLSWSKEGYLMSFSHKKIQYWNLRPNDLKHSLLQKMKNHNFTNLKLKLGCNEL